MKRLILGVGVSMVLAASAAVPAFADGSPQHTHDLSVPGVAAPVLAPGFCQVAAHNGFHEFHSNVHQGGAGVMSASGQVAITGTDLCVN